MARSTQVKTIRITNGSGAALTGVLVQLRRGATTYSMEEVGNGYYKNDAVLPSEYNVFVDSVDTGQTVPVGAGEIDRLDTFDNASSIFVTDAGGNSSLVGEIPISNVDGLQTELDSKASSADLDDKFDKAGGTITGDSAVQAVLTVQDLVVLDTFAANVSQTTGINSDTQTALDLKADAPLSRIQVTQANYATTLATIDSTKQYLIDGIVDVGALEITVPVGGLYTTGFGASISKLISSEDNHTMFTSASCGNITVKDMTLTTSGASSKIYDLKSSDGFSNYSALNTIYEDCTGLGILDGFLQGLELDVIRRGGSPDLTLEGTWLAGFLAQTTLVRFLSAGMTGALYKKGTAFSMTSRFKINANVDLPASASFIDFEPANFVNASSLQIQDAVITRNGVQNADDTNLTPNITMSDLQSAWKNNQGLKNTFVGGKLTVTTEVQTSIAVVDTFYTLLGTMTVSDLEHFSQVDNYKLVHLGNNPREFKLYINHIMDGGANDEVTLRIRKYDDSTSAFSTVYEQTRTVDNLTGGRDVAYFTMSTNTVLDKDDYIFLDVANRSDTANVTTELTSFLQVEER